jgi:hypothetical protein
MSAELSWMPLFGAVCDRMDALFDRMDNAFGWASPPEEKRYISPYSPVDSAATINGVELPQRVLDELKRLGIALANYNAGELQAAVRACAIDGQLIDDKNGANFFDQLELDDDEIAEDSGEKDASPWRGKPTLNPPTPSDNAGFASLNFTDLLALEREKNILLGAGVNASGGAFGWA